MSNKSFVHLHSHANASMLDGLAQISKLIPAVEEQGMPAIALTDHGSMAATYDLYKATKDSPVKPIYGIEAYVAPGVPRTTKEPVRWNEGGEDDVSGGGAYTHMTLLAETNQGLKNLFKISSESYLTGFYKKPRCLLAGQEIMTRGGMKPIEKIQIGDEVLTHNGRFRKVLRTMVNHHEGDIYGIKLGDNYARVTWMTGEHPVLIRNNKNEKEWIEAKAIIPGRRIKTDDANSWNSWVAMPKVLLPENPITNIELKNYISLWQPITGSTNKWIKTSERPNNKSGSTNHYSDFPESIMLDEKFGFILGLYISEGSIDRGHSVSFYLHEDETETANKLISYINEIFNKPAKIVYRKDRENYKGIAVTCNSSILSDLLSNLCGSRKASNKAMPEFVFDSTESFAKSVFNGVLEGDGSKTHPSVISLGQTSEQLHWQMRTLAALFSDDFANTYKQKPVSENHTQSYRSNYTIGKDRKFRHTISDKEYVYKPISAIEVKKYSGLVYNIEVEEDNSYVSDFAIHNCDEDLFQTFGKGIIATTGCPSGEVQTWLRIGDYQKAKEAAAKYADIFGKENYFVELMDHGLEIERRVIKQLIQIAKELGLQTVATNDLHYVHQSDSHAHEALLCIGSGSKLSDPNRFKFDAQDFYLKSAAEMRHIWDDVEGAELACDNTLLIAERVHADFEHGEDLMPKFPVPEGETEASWLRKEVEKGFKIRYGGNVPQEYRERADYELGIIERMKFPGYFLVVADYINWAKEQGIRVGPARGCLSGDSNVLTPDGIVNIKDIKVGAKVFNQHGEIVEVPAVFKYECSEELIEIKAFYGADGNKMTADHKVLVSKANKTISKHKLAQGIKYEKEILKPEWVRADQVEIGDLVVTPKIKFPIVKEEFTFEPESITQINIANSNSIRSIASKLGLARSTVMKHYQSEGSAVGPKQEMIRASLADNSLGIESEIIKRKTITTTKINSLKADYDAGVFFGLFISDGWIRSNGSAEIGFAQNTSEDTGFIPNLIEKLFGLKPTVHISDKRKLTQYVINHKGIKNLLANLFNQYEFNAGSKYIPLELLHTSEDFRKGLLEGLWYGDGSHKGHSKYTTVSKKLANDVMLLLLSLGLPASVKGYKRVEKRQEYNKTGRPFHIEYSVTTAHNFDLNTIIMGKGYDGEYTYYRVREINKVPSEGYVYDFTVPGTNSYVTDSYVVHNSGGGSFVCYLLNITDIDPMQHGLLFERFLNPERVSMPDLDIDFDDRRRGEVIEYVKQKYGEDKVANIATFSTIKAKAAFKDSLRVLGAPYMLGDKLSKAYPAPIVGRDLALADAYDPSHERYDEAAEFRALVEADPEAQKAIELGLKLEGVKRGFGMHAAGVIMSAEPIVETVPLMKRDTNSPIMTQFEYPTCEYLGLIKMDFLGLSNLGTIDECLRLIKQNRNEEVDLDKIGRDLDDKKTFELLAEGNTIGVFQLDSPPMRALLKLMAPDQFDDISAVLALYRPGPMAMNAHNDYADRKNKRKPVIPIHRELIEPLAPILDETFGIICYQEQVMAIAQKVAGYSLGQADLLRRAMGKKSKEVLDKEYIPFSTGMRENGYSDEAIQTLWEILLPFSDYAFNKSHSAGYGLISYWTAYLKANFPAEYMAALLTTNADNKDKLALYLGECRRMGIKVLPPDVNESELNYTAVGENIRVGMIGIKGVGEAGVNLWLQERRENGHARSFADFLERADTSISAKGKVEALILAGAFDCFGVPRSALYSVHEAACEKVRKLKKAKPKNDSVVSLFDSFDEEEMKGLGLEIEFPDIAEWDKKEKLARERAVLGLYVSDHPLSGFVDGLELLSTHSIAYLRDSEHPPTEQVKIAGLVSHVDRKLTKKAAEPWAIVTVEDLDSGMPVMVFPKTYADVSDLLVPDAILVFTGRVEKRDDGSTTFAVRDIAAPDMAAAQRKAERAKAKALEAGIVDEEGKPVLDKSKTTVAVEAGHQDDGNTNPVMVNVHETQMTSEMTERFKELMLDFVGSRPVHLTMTREDGSQVVFALGDQFKVVGTGQFAAEVRALFGPDSV